ncbi:MAG: BatD family protein [Gemmatimonadetes bacterium]|nr:BatD family protein [Gemmatimonadota bacterium]
MRRHLAVLALAWCTPAVLCPQAPARGTPEIVAAATVDPAREINFASGVWPGRVYAGQQATYQIGIFLSESMRSRLRSNPQFVPPDVRSVIAYDLPLPGRLFSRSAGDRVWDVHVYSRALFPVAPGTIDIAPARLNWLVPLSNSIFAREESHSATSSTHRLQVSPPPTAGRPTGYAGAVGQLGITSRVDASAKRVGNPFVLTVTVSGTGNVGLFPRPDVGIPWAHVVAGPERVRVDSSSALIRGDKAFEWVVTPRVIGRQDVPEIRYPYFNPYTEQYEVGVISPLSLTVADGGLVVATEEERAVAPRYTVRRTWRGDVGVPWPASSWYWFGVLVVPVPALFLRWRRRPSPVRALLPLDRLQRWASLAVPDPVEVRRTFRDVLAARVPSAALSLTQRRTLERTLRRAGVTASTARDVSVLLDELDASLYSGNALRRADVAQRALDLCQRVDHEAVPHAAVSRRVARRALGVVMVLGAGLASARDADPDAAVFRAALARWDAGDVPAARAGFLDVAQRRPRSADAWMNTGTAAWVLGDTAQAVVGWQRALRLEPMADDARTRLVLTPSFRDGLLGDIPPVPTSALAMIGLGMWAVAWWRPGRTNSRWLAAAIVVGGAAVALREQQVGRRQLVIAADEPLRDLPAVSGAPGARVTMGETARLVSQQGNWSRIRLADGREGWIEASQTHGLEVPGRVVRARVN